MGVSILGQNIKRLREEKGLSISKLKTLSEVGYATLHDIESGKTQNVNSKTLEKIAKTLETTPDELMGIEVIEVEVSDIESTINSIFKSDELFIDNIPLSEFERNFLFEHFKNGISTIQNMRNNFNGKENK